MDGPRIEMYYPDETSDEYEEARAGYRGMRSKIFEAETNLNIDEFMSKTLQKFLVGEG